jgi:hypothetical protein
MNHISLCYDFTVSSDYGIFQRLRICCLTSEYGKIGSKRLITWKNLPPWFGEDILGKLSIRKLESYSKSICALSTGVGGFHSSHLACATVN